jgi:upstream activation factor subunit UAF30
MAAAKKSGGRGAAKSKSASRKAPAKKSGTKAAAKRPAAKKAATKRPAAKKAAPRAAKSKTKRTPNAAFMKAMKPSPALAAVVGDKSIPRTEVTKKIWEYIKKNKLQDPKERRMIVADDKLKPVFGGKGRISMFEMTKAVNKHLS